MYDGPKVEMTFEEFGRDGNIFAIMGVVNEAIREQLDLPPDEQIEIIDEYRNRVLNAKSYQESLQISCEYVDFIDGENCDNCGELAEDCCCDEICYECGELEVNCVCF